MSTNMPYCQKCGKQINEKDKFCKFCGSIVEKAEPKIGLRTLLWVSLIIGFVVAINELTWVGRSDLAWVIFAIAAALILQAVYLLRRK